MIGIPGMGINILVATAVAVVLLVWLFSTPPPAV